MNTTLSSVIAFAAGAAIGSVVAWQLLKKRYERIAQEEIDSVKEAYSKKNNDEQLSIDFDKEPEEKEESEDVQSYKNILDTEGYINYSDIKKEGVDSMDDPCVIKPEDFGENQDYDTVTLYYYKDGIVADARNNIIDNVEFLIGENALSTFGDHEDDAVFVRNDSNQTYYEILRDPDSYANLMRKDYTTLGG